MNSTNPVDVTRQWLQVLADADYNAWQEIATCDLVIYTPFALPGFPKISEGRDVALAMARQYGDFLTEFAYYDVNLHATDEPGLVMGTCRSEAKTPTGAIYANNYCVITRVRDGRIAAYWEYFDPQNVQAAINSVTNQINSA
jgi:uncharacterized protein